MACAPPDDTFFFGENPLLDPEAVEALAAPDWLSRDDGRLAAGPDWFRVQPKRDEEIDHD